MLTQEQASQIRKQLLGQIESWQEPNKSQAKEQIESMSLEDLEEFLIKNNLIKAGDNGNSNNKSSSQNKECIFCSIIRGDIPSYKIAENKHAIAILEINPVSKAHALIIPKAHVSQEKIPSQAFTLAKKVAQKIKTKLSPKKVDISTSEMFSHGMINVLPVYNSEHLGMPRKKADEKQLSELKSILEIKNKQKTIKVDEKGIPISKPKRERVSKSNKIEVKLPKYPIRIP